MAAGNRIALAARLTAMAALAALPAGCIFVPVTPAPKTAPDSALDPCASRLHDIAGTLLLYYMAHERLPSDLSAIKQAGGEACPPLQCPVSGKPYLYDPMGVEVPGLPGWLVLYDATACHDGKIWALVASQMGPGKPFQVQVLMFPAGAVPAAPAAGGGPAPK
jgi:hypothetical protein